MTYLDELTRELAAHGIPARARRRILLETEDHLASDPTAHERFGSAREVANAFAAELGAHASRRAATGAFAALAAAGAVYATDFVSLRLADPTREAGTLASIAFAVIVVAPQLALVAGSLALLRAFRRRHERQLPTRELVAIQRRTRTALAAGLAAMVALAVYAYATHDAVAGWWTTLTYASTAAAATLLVLALVPTVAAARLRPQVAGDPQDVFDDLGLTRYRVDPWRFARRVAAAVGLCVWLAAAVQGDPLDGAVQGIAESLACLGGFAVLGRYLSLRR
jgi:hypothetical protein